MLGAEEDSLAVTLAESESAADSGGRVSQAPGRVAGSPSHEPESEADFKFIVTVTSSVTPAARLHHPSPTRSGVGSDSEWWTGRDSAASGAAQTNRCCSSHEKETAIKPRASRDREFYVNEIE